MKVFKTLSVQILLVGITACTLVTLLLMYFGKLWDYEGATVLSTVQIVVGGFAAGFTVLVGGNKARDYQQAKKGLYYDDNDNKLKNAE